MGSTGEDLQFSCEPLQMTRRLYFKCFYWFFLPIIFFLLSSITWAFSSFNKAAACRSFVRQRRGFYKQMSGYFRTHVEPEPVHSGPAAQFEARAFLDRQYGLCHYVYLSLADACVLLSHRWAERSGSKQQDRFSSLAPLPVPELPLTQTETHWHDLTLPPFYRRTHRISQRDEKRQQTEASLMASCHKRKDSTF